LLCPVEEDLIKWPIVVMDWIMKGFVGYGRMAYLWLYGMEEHCLDDGDAARRLARLPSFPLTIGVTEAHQRYGFEALPRGVTVWDVARDLAAACGLNATNVGEADGDVLLAELLPLPRRANDRHQWPSIYKSLFPDYPGYEDAVLRPRVDRLARLIVENAPRIVVVHGDRYRKVVDEAIVAAGGIRDSRLFAFSNKPARVVELGSSRIVFVHNFGRSAAWSAEARSMLSSFIGAIWRGDALDRFEMTAASEPFAAIESILVGMFYHRAGNVLPRELVAELSPCARVVVA
jgi:hypothetical protein